MKRKNKVIIGIFLVSACLAAFSLPASADEKITFMRPIPGEFSQNETFEIFLKTTYPSGSFIEYNFTLKTPYPHRGKLTGQAGTGGGTRVSDNRTFIFHDRQQLRGFIPGDWDLSVYEKSNPDKAYSGIIHIYPPCLDPKNKQKQATPDRCCFTGNYHLDVKLYPDPAETGGLFAKGQPLFITGKGLPDSDISVWIYKDTDDNEEGYSLFKTIKTDCNGDILGDGEIIPLFTSHTMPEGRYLIYATSGNSPDAMGEHIPDTPAELEKVFSISGIKSQKFTILAAEPEISFSKSIPKDIMRGNQLRIEGTTNLKSGTLLEILGSPTAVDRIDFQKMIAETAVVTKDYGSKNSNKWSALIDTSALGPGEYKLSVEENGGLCTASHILNVYDQEFEIKNPDENLLTAVTYDVNPETGDIRKRIKHTELLQKGRGFFDAEPESSKTGVCKL